MPDKDYKGICDQVRRLLGKSGALTSGEVVDALTSVKGGLTVPNPILEGDTPVKAYLIPKNVSGNTTVSINDILMINKNGTYKLYIFGQNTNVLGRQDTVDILVNGAKKKSIIFESTDNEAQVATQHFVVLSLQQGDNISLKIHTARTANFIFYGAILCINWDNTF